MIVPIIPSTAVFSLTIIRVHTMLQRSLFMMDRSLANSMHAVQQYLQLYRSYVLRWQLSQLILYTVDLVSTTTVCSLWNPDTCGTSFFDKSHVTHHKSRITNNRWNTTGQSLLAVVVYEVCCITTVVYYCMYLGASCYSRPLEPMLFAVCYLPASPCPLLVHGLALIPAGIVVVLELQPNNRWEQLTV